MTAKEYLKQAYLLGKQIHVEVKELEQLREMRGTIQGCSYGEKIGTNPNRNLEAPFIKTIEKIWEYEQKIDAKINRLVEGAKRIQDGNLEEEIVYEGQEEFERVCRAFNEMQRTILEDQKIRERNEKARTDMVTGISHDLRTPLTSIRGYIKGVLDGVANTEDKRTMYLETAYESTEDMNILLQKLFDFSRMESGQMPVHMIQIDLAEYVQGFTAQKEKTLDRKSTRLNSSHP